MDGGRKSRNALQGADGERVPGRPYYYTDQKLQHPQNYDFDPQLGRGSIKVYDVPMGMRIHAAGYFETAIVAMPHAVPDQVVISLRWGWIFQGLLYSPLPDRATNEYQPLVSDNVSQTFRDILHDNYADYELA